MAGAEKKKEMVRHFLERGFLVSGDFLDSIGAEIPPIPTVSGNLLVLQKEILPHLHESMNWKEIERARVLEERGMAKVSLELSPPRQDSIKILECYNEEPAKREVSHFVDYFNMRYRAMERMLKTRQELVNLLSISRAKKKQEKENISVIGIVLEKATTKTGNIMLTLEDPTGTLKVLVSKNKLELFIAAKDIVLDEVIGVAGVNGENILFANEILWPDVPLGETKRGQSEGYALFLSDLHIGSKNFLEKDFQKFLGWISGKVGNEKQKEIASNVKYLFVVGDIVDGCGIYPNQEGELEIKDITSQYEKAAELLGQIPKHIPLILCPGNHDAVRLSEPQPIFDRQLSAALFSLPNVILVSNPSIVNIHSSSGFSGFDILLYHGYSFDYYIANVDTIRNNGGYDRADLVMKFLLQRRHLAPTHTSSLYIPDTKRDPLAIEKVPDFFVTGHLHKSVVAQYKGITLISGSCWQSATPFQEKKGVKPEPSRVPVVNLQTRETKILRFGE